MSFIPRGALVGCWLLSVVACESGSSGPGDNQGGSLAGGGGLSGSDGTAAAAAPAQGGAANRAGASSLGGASAEGGTSPSGGAGAGSAGAGSAGAGGAGASGAGASSCSGPVGTMSGALATGINFLDTDGQRVDAHGGGIIQVGDT